MRCRQPTAASLTPEHRAYVRQKLEALLTAYRQEVRLDDPRSVNANGTLVR